VLSHDTVLLWENHSEYDALLDALLNALIAEHRPQGVTEEHLNSGAGRYSMEETKIAVG